MKNKNFEKRDDYYQSIATFCNVASHRRARDDNGS